MISTCVDYSEEHKKRNTLNEGDNNDAHDKNPDSNNTIKTTTMELNLCGYVMFVF